MSTICKNEQNNLSFFCLFVIKVNISYKISDTLDFENIKNWYFLTI